MRNSGIMTIDIRLLIDILSRSHLPGPCIVAEISMRRFGEMPIYEYECTQCGEVEEVFQKFSDKPLKKCRHCSGKLHKLISQSTFHLKGTGWYVTDYANKSKANAGASKNKPDKTSTEKAPSTPDKKSTKKATD